MENNVAQYKFKRLEKALIKIVGKNYSKIMLAAEMVDGMTGTILSYSNHGANTRKTKECDEEIEIEIEKIWNEDKCDNPDKMWSGMHFIVNRDGKEEVKYFYHDPYENSFFLQADEWKQQYFPGMEFEPDDDEDNWWD